MQIILEIMEENSNLMKKEKKKSSTRLRKHAPTFLEIGNKPINPFSIKDSNSKAIPLLSPLMLSPQILYAANTIQTQILQNNGNDINNGIRIWKHPAMDPFQEPLSLCNFLQKQCVIMNNSH